ncbi:melanocortin-2 receptor accessory protein 2 isoform X4 [Pan troglodytes]|uniref:melanocortin-2 receptor accessory protein 2 isoform X4 n=1 Tax=Pan troglodytes TaxID=9598 RepID=UPI0007DBBC56|nr:melanocortin-2 receptor accessory protein 2 isoform X3 [Pan troglodytes]
MCPRWLEHSLVLSILGRHETSINICKMNIGSVWKGGTTRSREGTSRSNAESSEKRFRMNSFVSDFGRPLEPDKVFSRQGNEESRSLFHCYINEVERLDRAKACHQTTALDSDVQLQEAIRSSGQPEEELNRLMKFDIPNFVNTDQNSFGEDDLLISEPPIVLETKPLSQTSHKDLD